jgi:hypothetical protein
MHAFSGIASATAYSDLRTTLLERARLPDAPAICRKMISLTQSRASYEARIYAMRLKTDN